MRERPPQCALIRMITGPAIAMPNLVPQYDAGILAVMSGNFVFDHDNDATPGIEARAAKEDPVVAATEFLHLRDVIHQPDGEIAVVWLVIFGRWQGNILRNRGLIEPFI